MSVDGRAVEPGSTYIYRGCMLSGIPNFAMCVGYTNASWTLRADLTSRFVCRMLDHMDRESYVRAVPRYRDPDHGSRPLLDLNSGYVRRAAEPVAQTGKQTTLATPAELPARLRERPPLQYHRQRRVLRRVDIVPSVDGIFPSPGPAAGDAQMRTSESSPPNSFET